MKLLTALAVLSFIAAPVNAQLNHTGRYYGSNGSYTKCTTVGSYANHSTFCKSGAAAHDEDRRLAAKNACVKNVKAVWDANNPQAFDRAEREWVEQFPTLASLMKPNKYSIESRVALIRHEDPSYEAKIKSCFTANGFN